MDDELVFLQASGGCSDCNWAYRNHSLGLRFHHGGMWIDLQEGRFRPDARACLGARGAGLGGGGVLKGIFISVRESGTSTP